MNQPTKQPTRKVQYGALGGAVASIAMGALAIYDPTIYARVPPGFEGGLATLTGFVFAWIVKERG